MNDVIDAFTNAMAAAGIVTGDPIIADGRLHRVHIEGHRYGTRNGAYVLHSNGVPAGWFMDFVSGATGTWKSTGGSWHMDESIRRLIEAERKRRQAERLERESRKASEAARIWNAASPCTSHPYLTRKGVKSHGLRVGTWRKWIQEPSGWRELFIENALFVPAVDPDGKLVNLQGIFPEPHPDLGRDKDFLGGRKKGCAFYIGEPTDTVLIGEGYATAATLHEVTGHLAVVAFDCGNLLDVARSVRQAMPNAMIILCADNDRHTDGNPGLTKARAAAVAVGGRLLIPPFEDDEPGSDWNDYYANRRFPGSLKKEVLNISPLEKSGREAAHVDA